MPVYQATAEDVDLYEGEEVVVGEGECSCCYGDGGGCVY